MNDSELTTFVLTEAREPVSLPELVRRGRTSGFTEMQVRGEAQRKLQRGELLLDRQLRVYVPKDES